MWEAYCADFYCQPKYTLMNGSYWVFVRFNSESCVVKTSQLKITCCLAVVKLYKVVLYFLSHILSNPVPLCPEQHFLILFD